VITVRATLGVGFYHRIFGDISSQGAMATHIERSAHQVEVAAEHRRPLRNTDPVLINYLIRPGDGRSYFAVDHPGSETVAR
jgi:hypothetical protein